MKWKDVKEHPAPERDILVLGNCGMPHYAVWRHEAHCHTESCGLHYGTDPINHITGDDIKFSHWMDFPKRKASK